MPDNGSSANRDRLDDGWGDLPAPPTVRPAGIPTPVGLSDAPLPSAEPGVPVPVPAPADAREAMSDGERPPSRATTLPGSVSSPLSIGRPAPVARPAARSFSPGLAAGLVAVIGAGLWLAYPVSQRTAPREQPADAAPEAPAVEPTSRPAAPRLAVVPEARAVAEPTLVPTKAAPPDPEPPQPAVTDARAGLAAAEAALQAGEAARAHELATAAEPSSAALRVMILASCDQLLGGRARATYRTLRGGALRAEVRERCKEKGVDVTLQTREDTAAELVGRGKLRLAAGEPDVAHDLARRSHRLERSPAAVLLMGRAGCQLGDAEKARFAWAMLRRDLKETLARDCPGIDLAGS